LNSPLCQAAVLEGKVALVTGASRGIGRSIALCFAQAGATVAIHYAQNQAAAIAVVEQITALGGHAFPLKAPLENTASVHQLYHLLDTVLLEHFGGTQFDILVNNAGVLTRGAIEELTEDQFNEAIAVNLKDRGFNKMQFL